MTSPAALEILRRQRIPPLYRNAAIRLSHKKTNVVLYFWKTDKSLPFNALAFAPDEHSPLFWEEYPTELKRERIVKRVLYRIRNHNLVEAEYRKRQTAPNLGKTTKHRSRPANDRFSIRMLS